MFVTTLCSSQSLSSVLSIVLAIFTTLSSKPCVAAANVDAVSTVYIVPSADSSSTVGLCPNEPCLTMDEYASNSSLRDGISDITMKVQPGYHNLSVEFSVTDISSLTMIGTADNVTLLCTEQFMFSLIDDVRISGINLINCGDLDIRHISNVDNFTMEGCTFQSDTGPFRIRLTTNSTVILNSIFSNSTRGVLALENTRPLIRNCTFSNNVKLRKGYFPRDTNGGAIYLDSTNAIIDDCIFKNNLATSTSGAVYVNDGTLYIVHSYFFNNSANQSEGGAVYSIGASLTIEESNFTNNVGHSGGAVIAFGEENTVVIRRSEFRNNSASFEGGAVLLSHRNNDLSRRFSAWITNSRFVGNNAGRGGAVLERGSNIYINVFQSLFSNNVCNNELDASGALYMITGRAEIIITQVAFTRNYGVDGAVGVVGINYSITVRDSSFVGNIATKSGGGLVSSSSDVGNITIVDSEFDDNSAPQCGSLDLHASDMNPNILARNALSVKIISSTFVRNSASVGRGGAVCTSDGSLLISGTESRPVTSFVQNTANTGGAISTTNCIVTISGANFSENSARSSSGGSAIQACNGEVTVESSTGLLSSNMDGQCLLYNNGEESSQVVNFMLVMFTIMIGAIASMLFY